VVSTKLSPAHSLIELVPLFGPMQALALPGHFAACLHFEHHLRTTIIICQPLPLVAINPDQIDLSISVFQVESDVTSPVALGGKTRKHVGESQVGSALGFESFVNKCQTT